LERSPYSDEGCQPTFFNVIPDRSNVDQRPKFTARISRTTSFAFLSRAVLARLTNAASGSPPLWLALGVADIAIGLGRGRGINLIEVLVLFVVAIMIFGLGLGVRNVKH
jgi:hypothetical protein